MYSYANRIHEDQSIIYDVFVDRDLKYVVEIQPGEIVQALGASNKPINDNDM